MSRVILIKIIRTMVSILLRIYSDIPLAPPAAASEKGDDVESTHRLPDGVPTPRQEVCVPCNPAEELLFSRCIAE
jgi:hypothetical protein